MTDNERLEVVVERARRMASTTMRPADPSTWVFSAEGLGDELDNRFGDTDVESGGFMLRLLQALPPLPTSTPSLWNYELAVSRASLLENLERVRLAWRDGMKLVCAWCQTVLRDGQGQVTHGCCQRCADRVLTGHGGGNDAGGTDRPAARGCAAD